MELTCANCPARGPDGRCHLFPARATQPVVADDDWCWQHPLRVKAGGKSRGKAGAAQGDSEWMAGLKAQYAALGIDVDREAIKARAWLSTPQGAGRTFTKAFFVRWLNRQDRMIAPGVGAGKTDRERWTEARDATARAIWDTISMHGRENMAQISQAMRVARDKWGVVELDGIDSVKAGMALAMNNPDPRRAKTVKGGAV
jgi:hypothetical protein